MEKVLDDLRPQMENDIMLRKTEILFLRGLLPETEDEDSRYFRSLLVMLYAHLEGHVKEMLLLYVNYLNGLELRIKDANVNLRLTALEDYIQRYDNIDANSILLRKRKLSKDSYEYKNTLTQVYELEEEVLRVHEKHISFKSNISVSEVKRIFFKLGIIHEDELLLMSERLNNIAKRRHNIAHGNVRAGVKKLEYEQYEKYVHDVMAELVSVIYYNMAYKKYLKDNLLVAG